MWAQANSQTVPPSAITVDRSQSATDEQNVPGSIEEEMRAKRAIKFAENEHKENLERAEEVSDLGAKLRSSFEAKSSLSGDDKKRLDRLEKLAKQLRSKAGGSNSEVTIEKPPSDLKSAVLCVADSSEALADLVKKTPRQVVNASVIERANVLLQLIGFVRHLSRK